MRRFTSTDTLYTIPNVNIPHYWIRPQQILSGKAGVHRFLWDVKYKPLNIPAEYPIAATYKNTVPVPTAPWVLPGKYTVRLLINGNSYEQTLEIKMDPRVVTTSADLEEQHNLSYSCYEKRKQVLQVTQQLKLIHS